MVFAEGKRLDASNLAIGAHAHTNQAMTAIAATGNLSLQDVEKNMLSKALDDTNGNQSEAARQLGISRDTLRYRIKKFDLK
jgi:DNA-binding protein Fis